MDGTKSTLNVQEPAAPAQKEQKADKDTKEAKEIKDLSASKVQEQKPATPQATETKPAEAAKPTLATSKRPEQAMKILRPGAAVLSKGGAANSGSASDKPSLKAKSPAPPPPTKSPWAPVPKVESVSPVNPPVSQPHHVPPPPMATQDARAYESTLPPQPAREIAADTFDRSWRESERGASRELFNSANGRYEPAPEARRFNGRQDPASVRKPAVLQRPTSVANGSEPTSARSGSQAESGWGRRRGSSVSQGSVPPPRRMSTTAKEPEIPEGTPTQVPESAKANFSQRSAWEQQMPPQPTASAEPTEPVEDPLKMQERVMREKRELAIKRRKEEEEREAQAKQERLKAKLAALEGAGKSKKEREAEAAAAASAQPPAGDKADESAVPAGRRAAGPNDAVKDVPAALQRRSEQHNAQSTGQSAHPQPEQTSSQQLPRNDDRQMPSSASVRQQNLTTAEKPVPESAPKPAQRANISPRASTRAPFQQSGTTYKAPSASFPASGDRKQQQPFGRSPNLGSESGFSPWPTASSSNNVWGSSGIGNGTFDNSTSFAPLPIGQSSNLPPPPGMGRQAATSRISPQAFTPEERPSAGQSQPQSQPAQSSEPRNFPPGIEPRGDLFNGQCLLNGLSQPTSLGRNTHHVPGPIGPPSRAQLQPEQPHRAPSNIAAWQNLASDLPNQYRANADAAAADLNRTDANSKPLESTFRETFKKTSSAPGGRLGGPRKFESTEYTVHDGQSGSMSSSANVTSDPWRSVGGASVPGQQPPIGPPSQRSAVLPPHLRTKARFPTAPIESTLEPYDLSPPPPETENHPVNSGEPHHPQVKLPPPQAKVRLPPASLSAPSPVQPPMHSGNVVMPHRQLPNYGPPGAARPLVQNEAWQMRFNGLFNRTAVTTETPPSPPKTPPKAQGPALAVASSSRTTMDDPAAHAYNRGGATVSLPNAYKPLLPEGLGFSNAGGMTSKPTIDKLFEEERSFGSLPVVSVPRGARYNTAPYPAHVKSLLSMTTNSRFNRPSVEALSKDQLPPYFFYKNPLGYHLKIPGTRLRNKLVKSAEPDPPRVSNRRTTDRPSGVRGEKRPVRESAENSESNKTGPAAPTADENVATRKSARPSRGPRSTPKGNRSETSKDAPAASSPIDKPAAATTSPATSEKKTSGMPKSSSARGGNRRASGKQSSTTPAAAPAAASAAVASS